MATRRQPLIPGWLIPGLSAATLVVAVALAAFLALWWNAPQGDWMAIWQDSYLWHVVRFSFWQAFLSALISVVPAIFLARALYRRRFPGRLALLRLCAMTLILPVLVAVFGILSVYGRQGWLASLWQSLGLEWTFSPYGLQGILLAPALGSKLLMKELEGGGQVAVTGFREDQWVAKAKTLWGRGNDVLVTQPGEDGRQETVKHLLAEDYIPVGMVMEMDGKTVRVDKVDFPNEEVSLTDITDRKSWKRREHKWPGSSICGCWPQTGPFTRGRASV